MSKRAKGPKTIRRVRYEESIEAGDCGRITPPSSLWINLYRWSYNGRITGHLVGGPVKGKESTYCVKRYDLRASSRPKTERLEAAVVDRAMYIYRNSMSMDTRLDILCEALYAARRATKRGER